MALAFVDAVADVDVGLFGSFGEGELNHFTRGAFPNSGEPELPVVTGRFGTYAGGGPGGIGTCGTIGPIDGGGGGGARGAGGGTGAGTAGPGGSGGGS